MVSFREWFNNAINEDFNSAMRKTFTPKEIKTAYAYFESVGIDAKKSKFQKINPQQAKSFMFNDKAFFLKTQEDSEYSGDAFIVFNDPKMTHKVYNVTENKPSNEQFPALISATESMYIMMMVKSTGEVTKIPKGTVTPNQEALIRHMVMSSFVVKTLDDGIDRMKSDFKLSDAEVDALIKRNVIYFDSKLNQLKLDTKTSIPEYKKIIDAEFKKISSFYDEPSKTGKHYKGD